MKNLNLITVAAASLFALVLTCGPNTASAQSAGSWVNVLGGSAGSGANADGMFQIAKTKSSSKNGVGFGHGFALGAGPNGLAISNSIGVGSAAGGAAHNVQLNLGRNGAHVSHGGVVSQGPNGRVISGGSTGTSNGRVYGGSQSTGYGQNTRAYSKSHTRQFGGQVYQNQPSSYPPTTYVQPTTYSQPTTYAQPASTYSQPRSNGSASAGRRVIRGGIRMFGR
jgi:hypothetical protein